ncbi:MAG: single-stranded DNA-binding protein [Pseudomonadota bacterium]
MNIFSFTGRLGRDAEVRYTSGGTPVATFTAANEIGFGERKRTQWIKCTLWGKLAESGVIPYLTKGREVAVTGEVTLDEYIARDGANKASLNVRVIDVTLVGGKSETAHRQPAIVEESQETTRDFWETPENRADIEFDDELPF